MQHKCPDNTIYVWLPRVPNPRNCPRCKGRLDKKPKEKDVDPKQEKQAFKDRIAGNLTSPRVDQY